MNEQGSKKILFNKSTLLNLKAELLKKQEEVQEKKLLPQHKLKNFKSSTTKASENEAAGSNSKSNKSFKDNLQALDVEELEAYKKTKAALERKAELYEHLSNPVGDSQLASKFLVDFTSKKHQDIVEEPSPSDEPLFEANDDDSEWTEFVDCLGRTRKCLKTDLELFKGKDEDLMRSITREEEAGATEEPKKTEKPFLVQKTNDYLQSLREKWEQKERELMAKDKDIHYQDVLYDEARMHGVGYFSFSTDETIRQQQMDELLARREETLREQAKAEEKRRARDELVAARLKAARARQRLRAGLPPEDPAENQKDFNACLLELLNKQKAEAEARAKEEERKIKEQIEKERQKLREAYIRDWDRGKKGMEDKVKPFKEITQEEYVEQQREKRNDEFAPPKCTKATHNKSNIFDDKGHRLSKDDSTPKTWSDVRPLPKEKTPPPPTISDYLNEKEHKKGLYFSSSETKLQSSMKYKNFVQVQEPMPIQNELSDEDEPDLGARKADKRHAGSSNTEIPPPPTYDYYGPVNKKSRPKNPFESDIREAYAQGAKSLEKKISNRKLPQQYDFTLE